MTRLYVRGIGQLAEYDVARSPTGHQLTELEVLEAYGPGTVAEVAEYGSAILMEAPDALRNAFAARLDALGLGPEHLTKPAGLPTKTIRAAIENPEALAIRVLEQLAIQIGLDERLLGTDRNAGADIGLGVRLRVLTDADTNQAGRLSTSAVLLLAEAASLTSIADRLRGWLGESALWKNFSPSPDFGSGATPAYKVGYSLAELARKRLDLGDDPISSMRELVDERLGLTVIQGHLGAAFSGATVANGESRGLVLNIDGPNQSPLVRRATLAHELGHLLFDPDENLDRVRVDTYERTAVNPSAEQDFVEQRANAFAVAFLAPPDAIRARFADPSPVFTEADVIGVVNTFGISTTAARYHLQNVFYRTTDAPTVRDQVDDESWRAAEDFTLDYFRPKSTPPQRRGRFSKAVIQAYDKGFISQDTSSLYLGVSPQEFVESVETLRTIWGL